MARAPMQVVPEVQVDAGPLSVRTNALAFGGGVGSALDNLGGTLRQAAKDKFDLHLAQLGMTNELYASDASTDVMKQMSALYGDYAKREGRAAYEGLPDYQTGLDRIRTDALARMPNPESKRMLQQSLKYLYETYWKYGDTYSAQQFKKWQDDSAMGRAGAAGLQAQMAINNPPEMNRFLNTSDDEIRKLAETRFFDDDAIDAEVRKNRGVNIQGIVEMQIAQGDHQGAAVTFDLYKDEIDEQSVVRITKALSPILRADRAQNIVQTSVGRGPIDPRIMEALIQQESGGNQSAVSPKGAIGMMQVMPATARMVATEMGIPYDAERLKNDPAYNMALGTHYLEGLLRKYGGNYALALAAYNAGPGRVDAWIEKNGDPRTGTDMTAWIEAIPFDETRNYVKTILGNASGMAPLPDQGLPNKSEAIARVMMMTQGNDALRTEALSQLNQEYLVAQADYTEQRRQQQLLEDAKKEADSVAQNEYIQDSFSGKPKFTTQDVANDPRLFPESKRTIINFISADGEAPAEASRQTMGDILRRMRLPQGDPERIATLEPAMQSVIDGDLSKADYKFIEEQFTSMKTPDGADFQQELGNFFKGHKDLITQSNPMMGVLDPRGDQMFSQFQFQLGRQAAAMKAAGEDPWTLLDPASPNYAGNPAFISQYQIPLQESVQYGTQTLVQRGTTAAPPPIAPAPEAPNDFISRGLQGTPFIGPMSPLINYFRQSMIRGGATPEQVEEGVRDYQRALEAVSPYNAPKRAPTETPEEYLKRLGPQGSLDMNTFKSLALGGKLAALEQMLG